MTVTSGVSCLFKKKQQNCRYHNQTLLHIWIKQEFSRATFESIYNLRWSLGCHYNAGSLVISWDHQRKPQLYEQEAKKNQKFTRCSLYSGHNGCQPIKKDEVTQWVRKENTELHLDITAGKHIEAQGNWLKFCRLLFQMHFTERNLPTFYFDFTSVCSSWTHW